MMSDDIPVVGIIIYFHIYIVSNTSIGLKLTYSFFNDSSKCFGKSPATCFNGHVYM